MHEPDSGIRAANPPSASAVPEGLERLAKSCPSPEEPTLDGADRRAENLGDVRVVETLKISKHQNGASLKIQRTEGDHHVPTQIRSLDAILGTRLARVRLEAGVRLGEPGVPTKLLASKVGVDAVERDPDAPGAEPRTAVEPGQSFINAKEGVLRHVRRDLGTAEHADAEAMDPGLDTLKERVEGGIGTSPPRVNELEVGVLDRRRRAANRTEHARHSGIWIKRRMRATHRIGDEATRRGHGMSPLWNRGVTR